MFEYEIFQDLTMEEINALGQEGWEVMPPGISGRITTPQSLNVFVKRGFQEKTLIENIETGAKFWIDQTFSYGESIIIIFLTIFIFAVIGKIIYNFLFKKNA